MLISLSRWSSFCSLPSYVNVVTKLFVIGLSLPELLQGYPDEGECQSYFPKAGHNKHQLNDC